MKKHVLIGLQIVAMLWALACAVITLPKIFNYDVTTAYGIGAVVGTIAAFILLASPGLYAAKVMFLSKRKAQS